MPYPTPHLTHQPVLILFVIFLSFAYTVLYLNISCSHVNVNVVVWKKNNKTFTVRLHICLTPKKRSGSVVPVAELRLLLENARIISL